MEDEFFFDEEPENVDDVAEVKEGEDVKDNEQNQGDHVTSEHIEGEHVEGEGDKEQVEGEVTPVENVEGEQAESEHAEEHVEGEHIKGEHVEGEELLGEHEMVLEEQEPVQVKEKKEEVVEVVEEEEAFVEEPPPDPAAPYNLSDSNEALKAPFELRPDQLAEVEQIWDIFQDYTPAYTDIDGYITEKELVYILQALLLMTYTPEQLQELMDYCIRPPHPLGHISLNQLIKMVTIRQRDFPAEEELRSALQVLDPDRTGSVDREALKDMLANKGNRLPQKQLDNLIKEVDISNDGTIGVEDVVGTMCIDLNTEDIQLLRSTLYPDENPAKPEEEF